MRLIAWLCVSAAVHSGLWALTKLPNDPTLSIFGCSLNVFAAGIIFTVFKEGDTK